MGLIWMSGRLFLGCHAMAPSSLRETGFGKSGTNQHTENGLDPFWPWWHGGYMLQLCNVEHGQQLICGRRNP